MHTHKANIKWPFPEHIHTTDIIQIEQIVFTNMYVYTWTHVTTIKGKRGHNLKESREGNI